MGANQSSLQHREDGLTGSASQTTKSQTKRPIHENENQFGLLRLDLNNIHDANLIGYNCDIIAVHGLNGHRERTWTYRDKESVSPAFWLRDFLPQDLPGARIYSYGYDTKIISTTSARVEEYAKELLKAIEVERNTVEVRI